MLIGGNFMKKNLGKLLCVEAIIILVFGLIGSVFIANQKTTVYKAAEYSWEEDGFETEEVFNIGIFISGVFSTIMISSVFYAGGTCYDKVIENNEMLLKLQKDDNQTNNI